MIRRPPRSTQGVSSAASDVYKRQGPAGADGDDGATGATGPAGADADYYTHLLAHETREDHVCRLLLVKITFPFSTNHPVTLQTIQLHSAVCWPFGYKISLTAFFPSS